MLVDDDPAPLKMKGFIDKFFGKLFGDIGYLSKTLFEELFFHGIYLVTKLHKNIKTKLLTPMSDAILLRKRAICETILISLKTPSRLSTPVIEARKTSWSTCFRR